MTDIVVSTELLRPLQQLATERGESVSAIVEQLIAEYLREQRHQDLLDEMERYRQQHGELRDLFAGEFIAMRHGNVIDHDVEGSTLYRRMRAKYGDLPILIVEVTDQPDQTANRLGRRLVS